MGGETRCESQTLRKRVRGFEAPDGSGWRLPGADDELKAVWLQKGLGSASPELVRIGFVRSAEFVSLSKRRCAAGEETRRELGAVSSRLPRGVLAACDSGLSLHTSISSAEQSPSLLPKRFAKTSSPTAPPPSSRYSKRGHCSPVSEILLCQRYSLKTEPLFPQDRDLSPKTERFSRHDSEPCTPPPPAPLLLHSSVKRSENTLPLSGSAITRSEPSPSFSAAKPASGFCSGRADSATTVELH